MPSDVRDQQSITAIRFDSQSSRLASTRPTRTPVCASIGIMGGALQRDTGTAAVQVSLLRNRLGISLLEFVRDGEDVGGHAAVDDDVLAGGVSAVGGRQVGVGAGDLGG